MKIIATFCLYENGEALGSWEEISIAVLPPVGVRVTLPIGGRSLSGPDGRVREVSDLTMFHGIVRGIDHMQYERRGEVYVHIDVDGKVEHFE